MARKLNEKEIKARIRVNKVVMRENKKVVTENMNAATKGEIFSSTDARKALSTFIKAAEAVKKDTEKLNTLQKKEDNSDA